jgi:hypothetical protein
VIFDEVTNNHLEVFVDFGEDGSQKVFDVGFSVAASFDQIAAAAGGHPVDVLSISVVGLDAVVALVRQVAALAVELVSGNLKKKNKLSRRFYS